MTKLQKLKSHLRPGQVYRRQDLARWSNAVDRHVKLLVDDGTLTKLSGGLYECPKQTSFGKAPVDDEKLVIRMAYISQKHTAMTFSNSVLYQNCTIAVRLAVCAPIPWRSHDACGPSC
jgi:hypothetical protein